jgi:hypothetical protein
MVTRVRDDATERAILTKAIERLFSESISLPSRVTSGLSYSKKWYFTGIWTAHLATLIA